MNIRSLIFLFAILNLGASTMAQDIKKTPYYISLNSADGHRIHEISDETLSLQYHDQFGKWKAVPLKIYDWRRQLVTTLNIDKMYGLNSFVIDLKSIHSGWELNKIYMCELTDESGRKYELPIKLVPPPDKKDLAVEILVNPIELECDGLSASVVEFYGQIKGGKGPYVVSWYVLNSSRSDFLYQPREETLASSGKTMSVTVDKSPDYYVVLYVKDACGSEEQQIVNMVCEESRKKINTIFVQESGTGFPHPKKIQ
jgi:hypothetical protein